MTSHARFDNSEPGQGLQVRAGQGMIQTLCRGA
eukprot:CAMPEP_0204564542 /NCGR_PEP_ID=MMETSP0661-20131031/34951_1 /ASSEMBLY_ACC=CAM_ASM_000606 /TAXON_ID=109239 /ORGANISM="Alexandrium margalefi, Strain AMGDE01CS-322" /LENGTH=32 /DNA_ID= /DNA_START= /DNA_END= /DNA_ORIENTATION=